MDKCNPIETTKDADGVEPHRSKLAHCSKTSTKDENQGANTNPGCKVSVGMGCERTTSCHASFHDIEDGPAPGVKREATPAEKGTETSNTNVSDHLSDGAHTSEPKKDAKKGKVVKKGIAQIVKKEKKKGGWKYVEESEIPQAVRERRK